MPERFDFFLDVRLIAVDGNVLNLERLRLSDVLRVNNHLFWHGFLGRRLLRTQNRAPVSSALYFDESMNRSG